MKGSMRMFQLPKEEKISKGVLLGKDNILLRIQRLCEILVSKINVY